MLLQGSFDKWLSERDRVFTESGIIKQPLRNEWGLFLAAVGEYTGFYWNNVLSASHCRLPRWWGKEETNDTLRELIFLSWAWEENQNDIRLCLGIYNGFWRQTQLNMVSDISVYSYPWTLYCRHVNWTQLLETWLTSIHTSVQHYSTSGSETTFILFLIRQFDCHQPWSQKVVWFLLCSAAENPSAQCEALSLLEPLEALWHPTLGSPPLLCAGKLQKLPHGIRV